MDDASILEIIVPAKAGTERLSTYATNFNPAHPIFWTGMTS
jgi:hypothetical protein